MEAPRKEWYKICSNTIRARNPRISSPMLYHLINTEKFTSKPTHEQNMNSIWRMLKYDIIKNFLQTAEPENYEGTILLLHIDKART